MSELILISLPIGNNKDITLRALETLKSENVFFAEDTRVFKQLLDSYGVSYEHKFIDSFHDQSVGKIESVVNKLREGFNVCLVSDAGSPVISDPAFPLLKRMVEDKISIRTMPGVSSVITALELSALPPNPFHFWGFIGRGKNEKKEFFLELQTQYGTHIFFESPHRVLDTIQRFFEIFPHSTLVVARELTKTFETVYRLSRGDLASLSEIITEKGEFVLLFHNETSKGQAFEQTEIQSMMKEYLEGGGGPKKLAKIFAKALNCDTKTVYDQLNK